MSSSSSNNPSRNPCILLPRNLSLISSLILKEPNNPSRNPSIILPHNPSLISRLILKENIMARSYASSNSQREFIDYGEANPTCEYRWGNQLKLITSWTNDNPGRRFWLCPNSGSRRCRFIGWFDPPMCKRSKKIIPGLLKRLNKQDEELKSLHMRLRLARNGARTVDNSWFKSWRFKVVVLVIIVVLSVWLLSSGMNASSNCKPVNQLMRQNGSKKFLQ